MLLWDRADLASDTEEEEERELGDYTSKTGAGRDMGYSLQGFRVEGLGFGGSPIWG